MLGSVIVKKTFWNILFASPVNERRRTLYNLAMQDARYRYGDDIVLRNLRYIGSWSPMSLVLYFSLLGFVEDASLTADVVRE
jgi:hypothetical protein